MTNTFSQFQQFLPLLLPVLAIQVILMIFALLDLRKQTALRGPKWLWLIVIIFINLIGPILYFAVGRKEE